MGHQTCNIIYQWKLVHKLHITIKLVNKILKHETISYMLKNIEERLRMPCGDIEDIDKENLT